MMDNDNIDKDNIGYLVTLTKDELIDKIKELGLRERTEKLENKFFLKNEIIALQQRRIELIQEVRELILQEEYLTEMLQFFKSIEQKIQYKIYSLNAKTKRDNIMKERKGK